jgi:hypothetical protein
VNICPSRGVMYRPDQLALDSYRVGVNADLARDGRTACTACSVASLARTQVMGGEYSACQNVYASGSRSRSGSCGKPNS